MDALMITMLACVGGAIGGRWWLLVAAIGTRLRPVLLVPAVVISILIPAGVAAWMGAQMAVTMRGPGMLLFLALALLFAGAALCWPMRPLPQRLVDSVRGPVSGTIILLAAQISDSAAFIILAVAARTAAPMLTAAGGITGLIAAAALALLFAQGGAGTGRHVQWLRWGLGAILLAIGTVVALSALRLV
ncbi:MAG: hypothetical protein MUF41_01660 [Sphingopyxis sp.]|nr:hypothetical protein [Sphingopyxis sp.]